MHITVVLDIFAIAWSSSIFGSKIFTFKYEMVLGELPHGTSPTHPPPRRKFHLVKVSRGKFPS